jgi:hypothetical protein
MRTWEGQRDVERQWERVGGSVPE